MLILSFSKIWNLLKWKAFHELVKTSLGKIGHKRHFNLYRDHIFQVKRWNIGILRHAPYTSDHGLINWPYLHHDWSIISIIYSMKSVQ